MSGDSVLITGSGTGLGLASALYLAERGFRVYATIRNPKQHPAVLAAAAERGVELSVLELDLTDHASIDAAVETVVRECGTVFALVNNGGIGLRGCMEDVTDAEIRAVYEANVFGTMAATKAVLPHMRAAGRGRVVTITSVGGRISTFGLGVYCSSKFAQEGFGEALALELATFDGLHAVMIEPGIIKTERWGEHRGTAAGAADPASPYYDRFRAGEEVADALVERSRTRPEQVGQAIHEALTAHRPKMRYVVGRPAGAAIILRRYLPTGVFERLYWGPFLRRIRTRAAAAEATRAAEAARAAERNGAPTAAAEPAEVAR
jgi:NAD(P)-dependent dehydrogenase (short-subunit alcohol dehydrogenase family)